VADLPDIDTSSTESMGTLDKPDLGAVLSCSPLVFVSCHSSQGDLWLTEEATPPDPPPMTK